MELYFTKNDNESYFLVVFNNLNIEIIRISSNNKKCGLVMLKMFL